MSRQQNARRRRKERAETAVVPQAGRTPSAPMAVNAGSLRAFMRREAWAILALALLVTVSYWPATQADFVWDDVIFTTSDAVRNWSGLWEMWFAPGNVFTTRGGLGSGNTIEGHYWPLTYTTFWIEHKLWGFHPTGYHVVNVLLHLANTLLLLRLLQRLAVPGAWFVAAVFAIHPLHVESVAWVMERKDLLSALFYLGAVLVWLRLVEAPDWRRYLLVIVLFVAGMLSKSIVVTLPAALLILAWWKRGRVSLAALVRVLPLFAVGLVIALADLAFYRAREAVSFDFSLLERGLLAARLLGFYAGKLLWPTDLAVIYAIPAPDIADPAAWCYALAALALAALLWFARHRVGRGPLAGALFFVVTLAPVLGFVDFGYMQFSFAADRFQYLAGVGVMAVVVGAAAHGVGRCPPAAMRGIQVLAVAVLALFGTLTWRQSGVWQDEITLFSHVVSLNPRARGAYYNLGKALLDEGRLEESVAASRIAVEQRPNHFEAYGNLGTALARLGRPDEAELHYRRGLELNPRHAPILHNLADFLGVQGRHEEAIGFYATALESRPDLAESHAGMGRSLAATSRYEEALEYLRTATEVDPGHAEAWYNWGVVLYRLERYEEALRSFDRALSIAPDLETARAGLEQAHKRIGGTGERYDK